MATSSVVIDIRANTQKALNEFKTFSSQLENKFLISGLKLDVVRNALSQINREFQKSLGEQGLVSAQSMQAAENQAAILTNIYTGFSKTASARIVEDFSEALNKVAVQIGSTAKDIQGALSISPFLDRGLSTISREKILTDIQKLSTYSRRAGLGDNATELLNQFATGQTGGNELQEQDSPLAKLIGSKLTQAGAYTAESSRAMSIQDRTRIIQQVLSDIDLEQLAKETGGFRAVLEQFSASLFNPREGLLGAMKEFTLKTGEAPTTLFKETTKLFEAIFGPQGFLKTVGKELAKAFGLGDDETAFIKFLGRGIRFITRLITELRDLVTDLLNNPLVQRGIEIAKQAFEGIKKLFLNLDEVAKNAETYASNITTISPETIISSVNSAGETLKKVYTEFIGKNTQEIVKSIESAGQYIRDLIRGLGDSIRKADVGDESESLFAIIETIVEQVGSVLGALVDEGIKTLLSKGPGIILSIISIINSGLKAAFTEIFGDFAGQILAVLSTTTLLAVFAKRLKDGLAAWASRLVRQLPFVSGIQSRRSARQERLNTRGNYSSLVGGRMGFENQVVARLDAIIRLLGNYAGTSSPLELGPGGGAARERRTGRDGRTVGQRARDIAAARRRAAISRGGWGGIGARAAGLASSIGGLGSRAGSLWSALPGQAKAGLGIAAGLSVVLGSLALAPKAGASELGGKPGELPPELQSQINDLRTQQGEELSSVAASGASQQEVSEIRKLQKEELRQSIEAAKKQKVEEKRENTRAVVGAGFNLAGSLAGAAIGQAAIPIPLVGGLIGGVVGGLLGDQATKLLSDQFLDGVGKLGDGIGDFFGKTLPKLWQDKVSKPLSNLRESFSIENIFKAIDFNVIKDAIIGAIIPGGTGTLSVLEGLVNSLKTFDPGGFIGGLIKNISDFMSKGIKIINLKELLPWLRGGENNYSGKDQYGPALAKESIMSGRKAIVANEGEFVIPRDGFGIVADLVRTSMGSDSSSKPTKIEAAFNISLNVNGGVGVNDVEALRAPVLAIIEDAWEKVSSTSLTRGSTIM